MTDQRNGPGLEPHEQAWLDATQSGEARTITHRVGECEVNFTVDRRLAVAPVHVPHVRIQDAAEPASVETITFSDPRHHPMSAVEDAWSLRWGALARARSGRESETHISMPAEHSLEELLAAGNTTPGADIELETPLLGPEDLERIKDARVTAIPPSLGPQTFG
jgi:hypothetical protein